MVLKLLSDKYIESFDIWYWGRMEISWTDRVRNEVLNGAKEERNIVYTTKRARLTGMVTSCVGTAFYKRLFKDREK